MHQTQDADSALRKHVQDVSLRIIGAAWPVRSAQRCRRNQRAERTLQLADHRRSEYRPDLVLRRDLYRLGSQLGREVDQVVHRDAVVVISWRLGWKRLRP